MALAVEAPCTLDAILNCYFFEGWLSLFATFLPIVQHGSPIYVLYQLFEAQNLEPRAVFELVAGFLFFNGVFMLCATRWAVTALRESYWKRVVPVPLVRRADESPPPPRLLSFTLDAEWRELEVQRVGLAFPEARPFYIIAGAVISGFGLLFWATGGPDGVNVWIRTMVNNVMCLMLLGVALAAATTITREKERQTLEVLQTTPLDSWEILLAKWLAASAFLRSAIWAVLPVWALGILTGALHPLAAV